MISGIVAREIPPEVVSIIEQHRNPKKYLIRPGYALQLSLH